MGKDGVNGLVPLEIEKYWVGYFGEGKGRSPPITI